MKALTDEVMQKTSSEASKSSKASLNVERLWERLISSRVQVGKTDQDYYPFSTEDFCKLLTFLNSPPTPPPPPPPPSTEVEP